MQTAAPSDNSHKQVSKEATKLLDSLLTSSLTTNKSVLESPIDQVMFEYDQLRKEILQNDTLTLQVITVILLLSSALMGFAFSQTISDNQIKSLMFFIVVCVAFIGLKQNIGRMRSTSMIASYIKIFIEPHMQYISWETRLSKFRSKQHKTTFIGLISNQGSVYISIILINLALGSYDFLLDSNKLVLSQTNIIILSIINITAVISVIYYWRQAVRLDRHSTIIFDDIWLEIQNDERINPNYKILHKY